jgi:2-methylcitrate dehydratase PrpD
MTTATQRVAQFVAGFELASAPESVLEKAKVTLLHDLGVALAGHQGAGPAYELAAEIGRCEQDGARLPVTGTRVTVEQAALATGALMHARTQDDTQLSALTHLGCTVLPSLLALGDRADASGRSFLTAMVAGYEAASAIAGEFAAMSTKRGLRATSIYGPLGSAAACARLLGLTEEQTANALGLAVAFGGGTNQTWVAGTQEWQYQVGSASRNGMIAALLAQKGVSGAPDALEGVMGHYAAYAGTRQGAGEVGNDLGTRWQILEVTYKPYPICAINQVPVTVLTDLVSQHDIDERDVEAVTLRLSPAEAAYPGTDEHGPFTDVGGSLMSAPYCLAVAIRKRTVRVRDLRDFDDETLMSLVRRVEVVADPELPANSCRLSVRTGRGEFTAEYISTPETFNWNRVETAERLLAIVEDMPFGKDRLDEFVDVTLDIDNRALRDLVTATIA